MKADVIYEHYTAPNGESIFLEELTKGFQVCCLNAAETEVRWCLPFKTEADARAEFERWRK